MRKVRVVPLQPPMEGFDPTKFGHKDFELQINAVPVTGLNERDARESKMLEAATIRLHLGLGKPFDGTPEEREAAIQIALQLRIALSLGDILKLVNEWMEEEEPPADDAAKARQWLITRRKEQAKAVNAVCRKNGLAIKNPDSGEPCFLTAVQNQYGCRFALENPVTKKRSHSTNDLEKLKELELCPIAV